MYKFINDYSEGACKEIIEQLIKTDLEQLDGYGNDKYSLLATEKIKDLCGKDVLVSFITGGTPCNIIACSMLKPYEAVIACDTGHINVHETGAIENTGHKILTFEGDDFKVTINDIQNILDMHTDEHMVKPKLVFISNSTELGTIYKKKELIELSNYCHQHDLYLYLDGARLASALTCEDNDLTIQDIAEYCDMFYIGGTKNGALISEAFVVVNENLKEEFRYREKQLGFMLAKGRLAGISFNTFFTDNLYFKLASHANKMANILRNSLIENDIALYSISKTNQVFAIMKNDLYDKLKLEFEGSVWSKYNDEYSVIRFVTSWATSETKVNEFAKYLKEICE